MLIRRVKNFNNDINLVSCIKMVDLENDNIQVIRRAPSPPTVPPIRPPRSKSKRSRCESAIENVDKERYSEYYTFMGYSQIEIQSFWKLLRQITIKEEHYLQGLEHSINAMKNVSTHVCDKMRYLKAVQDFHTHNLRKLQTAMDPLDISNIFLLNKEKFHLYLHFAENRNDFSYLVVDIGEIILDDFKTRILEYNFILSEIKNIFSHYIKIKMEFTEAEEFLRNIFDKLTLIIKLSEIRTLE